MATSESLNARSSLNLFKAVIAGTEVLSPEVLDRAGGNLLDAQELLVHCSLVNSYPSCLVLSINLLNCTSSYAAHAFVDRALGVVSMLSEGPLNRTRRCVDTCLHAFGE